MQCLYSQWVQNQYEIAFNFFTSFLYFFNFILFTWILKLSIVCLFQYCWKLLKYECVFFSGMQSNKEYSQKQMRKGKLNQKMPLWELYQPSQLVLPVLLLHLHNLNFFSNSTSKIILADCEKCVMGSLRHLVIILTTNQIRNAFF